MRATTTAVSFRRPTPTHIGVYFDVAVTANAQNLGLIIHNPSASGGDQKDPGPNEFVDPATEGFEYWGYHRHRQALQERAQPHQSQRSAARVCAHSLLPPRRQLRQLDRATPSTNRGIHRRLQRRLTGVTSFDSYGAYFDISLIPNAQNLGFIIHNISTGAKDPGPEHVSGCRHQYPGLGHLRQRDGLHHDADADADTG